MRTTMLVLLALLFTLGPGEVLAQDYPDLLQNFWASRKFREGDPQGALADCTSELAGATQAEILGGKLRKSLTTCAMARHRLGRFREALVDAEMLVGMAAAGADRASCLYLRGLIHLDAGELQSAVEDFTKARLEWPILAEAFWKRGIAYEALGDHKSALADYDRAASRIPDARRRKELLTERMNRSPPVTDLDGKAYRTLAVGDQVWMTEDLAVRRLGDGTPAPGTRGYDWKAVGSTQLCPAGWHVPTEKDWRLLASRLGLEVRPRTAESVAPNKPPTVAGEAVALFRSAFPSTMPEQLFWSSSPCESGLLAMAFFFEGDTLRHDCQFLKTVLPVRCVEGAPEARPAQGVTTQEWAAKHEAAAAAGSYVPGSRAPLPDRWPIEFLNPARRLNGHYGRPSFPTACDVKGPAAPKAGPSGNVEIAVLCHNLGAAVVRTDQRTGKRFLREDPLPIRCRVVGIDKSSALSDYRLETDCGLAFTIDGAGECRMELDKERLGQMSRRLAWPGQFGR